MLDRFTGMQVLSRVAALGSFSAAARSIGLSQTMVTRHIDAIEDRLGVRLFHRSTRRLTLTEAGQDYVAAVERILAEVEDVEGAASAEASEPRGTLRLNLRSHGIGSSALSRHLLGHQNLFLFRPFSNI